MNKNLSLMVALRYLKSRRKNKGLSFNTAVSISGVALGVMALLVVLSVMSGYSEELKEKILGTNSHVVLFDYANNMKNYPKVEGIIKTVPEVKASSPFVLGQAMAAYKENAQGIVLKGIDPALEEKTTEIKKHMKEGKFDDLEPKDGLAGIVIGSELALKLGLRMGDKIRIVSPISKPGPVGFLPKVKDFRVSGIFEVGMYEYDSNLALVGIKPAQEFLDMGEGITGVEIRLFDPYKSGIVRKTLMNKSNDYFVKDWVQMNRNLFAALKLQKFALFIILTFIIIVAAFNIVSTLTMTVMEKESEIAILRAMGATRKSIMHIFIIQGFLIGLTGTLIGLAGGFGLGYVFDTLRIIKLPADVYYIDHLPIRMNLSDFVSVCLSAVAISFGSTVYPAWRASKLNPVEPLRYD